VEWIGRRGVGVGFDDGVDFFDDFLFPFFVEREVEEGPACCEKLGRSIGEM